MLAHRASQSSVMLVHVVDSAKGSNTETRHQFGHCHTEALHNGIKMDIFLQKLKMYVVYQHRKDCF